MREPLTRIIYNDYDLWDDYSEFAKETLLEHDKEPSENVIWDVINEQDAIIWDEEKRD